MSDKLNTIINEDKEYLFQVFSRLPAAFVSAKGSKLVDQDGKEYYDFLSGVAVNLLGYGDQEVETAAIDQIKSGIIHTSNWFYNIEQIEAAKLISKTAFKGKTFFGNSGAEANEAAIKLARRYGTTKKESKYEIISFEKSFHGRTFASMTATGQSKIHTGFGPLVPGFHYRKFNDLTGIEELAKTGNLCAIMVEAVQGEGGIVVAEESFIKGLADICKKHDALLIFDEIQTGIGRTGVPYAYQRYGITPDMITLAKGLGGGFPLGALHAKSDLAGYLPQGSHGSTFGGNHIACRAAMAVLKKLDDKDFMKHVNTMNHYFFEKLNALKIKHPVIKEIRGLGLHIGVELSVSGYDLVKKGIEAGLLLNCTADKVIRIMPPLNITKDEADGAMAIFEKIISNYGG